MIDFFFGKPRTGKTYRAVKMIYDQYISDDAEPQFTNILTNIGGFKFKEVNEIFLNRGSQSVAYKLVWKKFYEHLKVLHQMVLDEKSDEELNRYAYSHKFNDCLIVIDEASLYFKKYDDVLSWFLAYHGHFKVRIIMIAQSPKQIHVDYLSHTEIYYVAQPQSKQFSNNKLRYIHYSEHTFNKDTKFGSDTISTSKDIYDLYKSGEVDKPKKILYRYFIYMGIALLLMFLLYKFLMYRLSPPDDYIADNNQTQAQSDTYAFHNNSSPDYVFLNIRCDDHSCWNNSIEYLDNSVSMSFFKFMVLKHDLKLMFSEVTVEAYKYIKTAKGMSKVTLASFTDYYYKVPSSLKKSDLQVLFERDNIKNDSFKYGEFDSEATPAMMSALAKIGEE